MRRFQTTCRCGHALRVVWDATMKGPEFADIVHHFTLFPSIRCHEYSDQCAITAMLATINDLNRNPHHD